MRESRTSGSVEGAMGNHSSYSDPVEGEDISSITFSDNCTASGCSLVTFDVVSCTAPWERFRQRCRPVRGI